MMIYVVQTKNAIIVSQILTWNIVKPNMELQNNPKGPQVDLAQGDFREFTVDSAVPAPLP